MIATVTTFAGSGAAGSSDGAGTNAGFHYPLGLISDPTGNLYTVDNAGHFVRKISSTGVVTTLAGQVGSGFSDGTGTNAKFNNLMGIKIDSFGNIYVSDASNHRICKITSTGVVTTLAGGVQGFADDIGANAKFHYPHGLAVDPISGNIFLADPGNRRIRQITPLGVVTTLAGSGSSTSVDGTGTSASIGHPVDIVCDSLGNIYVTDSNQQRIRKIVISTRIVTTIAGSGTAGFLDATGTNAMFNWPNGLAIDMFGNLLIADTGNFRVRKITTSGVVTTIAGDGTQGISSGTGTSSKFFSPRMITIDSTGNAYVSDCDSHRIRKITFSPSLPGPLPVCDSTWHHIALTYSGSSSTNTLSAYVNGSLVASSTSSTFAISSSSTSALRLGWNGMTPSSTSGELFSGSISDIRIYNRSLSLSEINLLKIPPPSPSSTPSSSPTPSPTLTPTSSPTLTASRTPSSSASRTPSSTTSPSQITKLLTAAGGMNDSSSSSSLSLTSIVLILVGSNILLGVSVLAFVLLRLRKRLLVVPLGDETKPKTLQEQLVRLREKKLLQVEIDQNSIVDSTEAYVVKTETIHPHSNEELEKTMEFAGEVRLYQQLSKLRNKLDSNKKKKIKTLALEK